MASIMMFIAVLYISVLVIFGREDDDNGKE